MKNVKKILSLWMILIMAFCCSICMIGCSSTDENNQEEQENEEPTENEETSEVIYEANENINHFIVSFNDKHPDMAISADDISVYKENDAQVLTSLGDDLVIVSSSNLGDGVTVYYETYSENEKVQEYAESNRRVFGYVMSVLNPELDDDAIEQRWQDVLDDSINSPKWEDGISFSPGPSNANDIPGAFNYFELGKR